MKYVSFGTSGLRVSEVALGAMTFGEEFGWGASKAVSQEIFDAFASAGGNHIDTANEIYTGGTSEAYLGEFLQGKRDQFVIGTKFTDALPGSHANMAGNSRKSMVQSLERSLRRLKTDYVDIVWVHAWDYATPAEDVMRGLDDLVRAGKVLYLGISDAPAWVVSEANTVARLRGYSQFQAQQVEYSLVQHTADRELLPAAKRFGMTTMGYSALASGLLTGKYAKANKGSSDGKSRLDKAQFVALDDRNLGIADAVVAAAKELGQKPSHVALNWVRAKGVMPILGATKAAQLQDNLAALELSLPDTVVATLDAVAAIELGFPHDFLARTRQVTYGGHFEQFEFPFKNHIPA